MTALLGIHLKSPTTEASLLRRVVAPLDVHWVGLQFHSVTVMLPDTCIQLNCLHICYFDSVNRSPDLTLLSVKKMPMKCCKKEMI